MNILFVRISGTYGGAEKYNVYLDAMLRAHSSVTPIFVSNSEKLHDELLAGQAKSFLTGVVFGEVGTKRQLVEAILQLPVYLWDWLRLFRKVRSAFNINAVCFESMSEKLFFTLPFFFLRVPVYWLEHGPVFATRRSVIVLGWYRFLSAFTRKVICVSNHTMSDIVSGGVSAGRVAPIYIGMNLKSFHVTKCTADMRIRKKAGITLGYVGSLRFEKGVDEFLQLMLMVHRRDRSYRAIICGDGPQRRFVTDFLIRHGLTGVVSYIGEAHNVASVYQDIDILIFPTRCPEGLPLVPVEAAFFGCMVIASDTGGGVCEAVAPSPSGMLYTRKGTYLEHLASQIMKISAGTLAQAKKGSRQFVRDRFNPKRQAAQFETLICD